MDTAKQFELDWSDGSTLKFSSVKSGNVKELMIAELVGIPINTMCVSTGWGSEGKWKVDFM